MCIGEAGGSGSVQRGCGEGCEGSGERLGGFGAEPAQVQQGSGEDSGEGLGGFGEEPGQVQQGSGEGSGDGSEEGSGEGLGGFVAEPGQVQQGSGDGEPGQVQQGSGEGCRARSGSTGFRRMFGAEPGGVQQGSKKGSCEGLGGLVQSQVRFNRICGHLTHGNPAEVFPALGFAARFRKIYRNKSLRLLGIPLKLFFERKMSFSLVAVRFFDGLPMCSHLV